jgi:hypothetical protein
VDRLEIDDGQAYTFPGSLAAGRYFWTVCGLSATGRGDWASYRDFRIVSSVADPDPVPGMPASLEVGKVTVDGIVVTVLEIEDGQVRRTTTLKGLEVEAALRPAAGPAPGTPGRDGTAGQGAGGPHCREACSQRKVQASRRARHV